MTPGHRTANALLGALIGLWAASGAAHERSASYSSWKFDGQGAAVTLIVAQQDAESLGSGAGAADSLLAYATSRLRLSADGQPCTVADAPRRQQAPAGRLRIVWRLACPTAQSLRIESDLFDDPAAGHLHFATVDDAAAPLQRVLAGTERQWPLSRQGVAAAGAPSSGRDFVALGFEHILTGYDHLVFLFALLLCGGSFGGLVRVVTGFTVGHSITLALAVLNLVRPQAAAVEALIGLSIALVAVENVWLHQPSQRHLPVSTWTGLSALGLMALFGLGKIAALCWGGLLLFLVCQHRLQQGRSDPAAARWGVALLFGLIHGFGFASVLVESELPASRLVQALIGFNVGVELGQIALLALAWPALRWALERRRAATVHWGSAFCLSLGVFWLVSRNYA